MFEDVKNFYLMINGFYMIWSVKLDEYIILLGSMVINSILKLIQFIQFFMYLFFNVFILVDLEDDIYEVSDDQLEKFYFDFCSVIFELDLCNGSGKVCFVYKSGKLVLVEDIEIWFLDRVLYWYFFIDIFIVYYCLFIIYLGLFQW